MALKAIFPRGLFCRLRLCFHSSVLWRVRFGFGEGLGEREKASVEMHCVLLTQACIVNLGVRASIKKLYRGSWHKGNIQSGHSQTIGWSQHPY